MIWFLFCNRCFSLNSFAADNPKELSLVHLVGEFPRPEISASVSNMTDLIVIGAGPAGVLAALRAADLGANTLLVAPAEFGGMAADTW